MQGRKHVRFAVQLPASFTGDNLSGTGTILNLSQEGCAITSETMAGTEGYLQLTMQLREREKPVHVDLAAVRWSSTSKFGVEFIRLRSETGERLKQFVRVLESGT